MYRLPLRCVMVTSSSQNYAILMKTPALRHRTMSSSNASAVIQSKISDVCVGWVDDNI